MTEEIKEVSITELEEVFREADERIFHDEGKLPDRGDATEDPTSALLVGRTMELYSLVNRIRKRFGIPFKMYHTPEPSETIRQEP